MPHPADIRIGISGWRYKPWRGVFYPPKLRQREELAYAASVFRTVEINGTFYSLQRPENFASWAAETPEDFVFAVKGPRFITHMKRLKDIEKPLANFLASGVFRLGSKLGPILWQFPPNFAFDPSRIESFLKLLPRTTREAAAIAQCHDKWLSDRIYLCVDADIPLRHVMEIRHPSFATKEFVQLLRESNVALVCADTVEWPRLMDVTSDFVYCRLHGSEVLYVSGYKEKDINEWACRAVAWATGGEPKDAERVVESPAPKLRSRDVYVYFDNDAKVHAPVDAKSLIARVDQLLGKQNVRKRITRSAEQLAGRLGPRAARESSTPRSR